MSFSVVREHDKCDTFAVAAGSCSTALPIVVADFPSLLPPSLFLSLSLSISSFTPSLPPLLFLSQRKLYQTLMPVWALTCSSYARVLEQQRGWEKIEAQKEAACGRVMRIRHGERLNSREFSQLWVCTNVVELMWRTGMGQDTDPKLLSVIVTLMSTKKTDVSTISPLSRWHHALSLHLDTR